MSRRQSVFDRIANNKIQTIFVILRTSGTKNLSVSLRSFVALRMTKRRA
jgi:hypothetical protein